MTNEQIIDMIRETEKDNRNILQLYNNNIGLINKIINKHTSNKADKDDMMQDAYIVLLDAVEKYEPESLASFSTFYANYLHWYYYRNKQNDFYIPAYMNDRIIRLNQLENEYLTKQKKLTDSIIKRRLKITQEELESVRKARNQVKCISIYEPQDESGEVLLLDMIEDENNLYTTIDEKVAQEQIKIELWSIIDTLNDSELLHKHFESNIPLAEIARDAGIKESSIYDRYKRAMRNLRTNKQGKRLKELACDSGIYSKGLQGGISSFMRTNTSATEKTALKLLELELY